MRLIKHIGINIVVAAIIIPSLHFPVVYGYIHLFVNNNHTECREYAKVHFHKKDVACYVFNTLKPNDHIGFTPDNFELFTPKHTVEHTFNAYFFLRESSILYFLRRGPPSFA